MPRGHVPGQPVAVPAGSGVPAHEAGVLHAAAGQRDGHPPLGEEDLLTWRSQVEGPTCEMFTLNHPLFHSNESCSSCDVHLPFFSLQVWEFSHLFSAVDSWHMADTPPVSAHLKVCPFYETSEHSERVPLPSMSKKKEDSKERMSLVNLFTGNRWPQ